MKKTKSIRTYAWWRLDDLQLTNRSAKKSWCPMSRRLKPEDLNFGPVTTAPAASVAKSLLYAPHQPSDLVLMKLIVPLGGGSLRQELENQWRRKSCK